MRYLLLPLVLGGFVSLTNLGYATDTALIDRDGTTTPVTLGSGAYSPAVILTTTTPNMDGVGSAGSGSTAARVDHVHPTDTSRLPVDNPTATGTVTAPQFNSNVADGLHAIFCANSGDMDTTRDSVALPLPNSTAWGTADAGRYCFNQATGKTRQWTCPGGVCALSDWVGGSGGGSFATLTGSPSDNAALNTALTGKQAALGFTPLNPANNLSELANKSTAVANIGAAAAVGNQDIEITDATKGLLLRSTGGNRYRILVADNGTLSTSLVNATVFAPNAPSGLSASGGNLQTTVSWSSSVVDASHSAPTSYDVLWGTTSGGESNTLTGVTSPYTHTGLTASTQYFYKVRANNSVGSATSTETSATTNSTVYQPNPPTGVTATAGNTQNTIAWTAGTVDGTHSAATSYNLLWGTTSGGESNTIAGVTSPYIHASLTNGQAYYYKVRAINTGGQADSVAEATATPAVIGLLNFETASLTPNGLTPAYTNNNSTYAVRQSTVTHSGTYGMAFSPTNAAPYGELVRAVTLPSSGTVTFERWINASSLAVPATPSPAAIFGLGTQADLNTGGDWIISVFFEAHSLAPSGLQYYTSNYARTSLYPASSMTANTWYRVSVTLNCSNNTYSTYVYNASGTQLASATNVATNKGTFAGQTVYSFLGRMNGDAPTFYIDDITDGL